MLPNKVREQLHLSTGGKNPLLMTRAELHELGYIAPIATVPSILERGILSHRRAERIEHESIALQDVQNLRAAKTMPNGRTLHEYANLYICPRNPMLLKKSAVHDQICVLRVNIDVLDIPNTIVSDSNAASKYVRFRPAPAGLAIVDRDRTFAEWWTMTTRSSSGATRLRNVQKCLYQTWFPRVTSSALMSPAMKVGKDCNAWRRT